MTKRRWVWRGCECSRGVGLDDDGAGFRIHIAASVRHGQRHRVGAHIGIDVASRCAAASLAVAKIPFPTDDRAAVGRARACQVDGIACGDQSRSVSEIGEQIRRCQSSHQGSPWWAGDALRAGDDLKSVIGQTRLASADDKAHLGAAVGREAGNRPTDHAALQRSPGDVIGARGQCVVDDQVGAFSLKAGVSDPDRISKRPADGQCAHSLLGQRKGWVVNGGRNHVGRLADCADGDERAVRDGGTIGQASVHLGGKTQIQDAVDRDIASPGDDLCPAIIAAHTETAIRAAAVASVGRQDIGDEATYKGRVGIGIGDNDGIGQEIVPTSCAQVHRLGIGKGLYLIKAHVPGCAQRAGLLIIVLGWRVGARAAVHRGRTLAQMVRLRKIPGANEQWVLRDVGGTQRGNPTCIMVG